MRTRSILGTAAAAAGLMVAALAPGASAAEAPASAKDGQTVAAKSPTVSPSAPYTYVKKGNSTNCGSGNLCLAVNDPTRPDTWKVFKLYTCRTYSLSYWNGTGYYYNNQTGSRATATFYGSSGNVLKNVPINASGQYNWSPVWKIRNCY
ncbi:hypothetical protein [Streptomyces sp. UG1]|uniref:hypothetical protein n=1 Tax=Streptomyces sp. UG1 TaxID=3417652 RepID=UPI003CEA9F9C